MRRVAWSMMVIGGSVGVIALVLGAGAVLERDAEDPRAARQVRGWSVDPPLAVPTSPTASERSPTSPPDPTITAAVRDVTPATVTPPPAVSGPLIRIEPPPPPAPPAEPWRPVMFHRPTILPNLSFSARPPGRGAASAQTVIIRLEGVAPLATDATCKDALGDEGPCGMVAASALRALIGAKAVECNAPRVDVPSPLITTCRLGARDLGAWLIERGYARDARGAPPSGRPGAILNAPEGSD